MRMMRRRLRDSIQCKFGRWYLAGEECSNVAVTVRRGAESVCGEAGREALALPQRHGRKI